MDNSFFVFSDEIENLRLERFHICTWDFRNRTAITEIGIEVDQSYIKERSSLNLKLYIPWLDLKCTIKDFYEKLMNLENSKFIFNNIASGHDVFDDDGGKTGCLQKFKGRKDICLFPVKTEIQNNVLVIKLDLKDYQKCKANTNDANLYFRICIERPKKETLALVKRGINKSTVIYDVKLNEKRNLPNTINAKYPCMVETFFYFNIVPNDYSLSFYDNRTLKNIRTLEFNGFSKYLDDPRVKQDDLIVISCKDEKESSYSFFNVYSNEFIGAGALAIGFLLELICGILLFLPSLENDTTDHNLFNLPWELYLAGAISVFMLLYFVIKRFKPRWMPW